MSSFDKSLLSKYKVDSKPIVNPMFMASKEQLDKDTKKRLNSSNTSKLASKIPGKKEAELKATQRKVDEKRKVEGKTPTESEPHARIVSDAAANQHKTKERLQKESKEAALLNSIQIPLKNGKLLSTTKLDIPVVKNTTTTTSTPKSTSTNTTPNSQKTQQISKSAPSSSNNKPSSNSLKTSTPLSNSKSSNSLQQSKLPVKPTQNSNTNVRQSIGNRNNNIGNVNNNSLKRPLPQSSMNNQPNKKPRYEQLKTTNSRHIIDLEEEFDEPEEEDGGDEMADFIDDDDTTDWRKELQQVVPKRQYNDYDDDLADMEAPLHLIEREEQFALKEAIKTDKEEEERERLELLQEQQRKSGKSTTTQSKPNNTAKPTTSNNSSKPANNSSTNSTSTTSTPKKPAPSALAKMLKKK